MTTLNGVHHHNVDDLLASIRTSIADETGSQRSQNGGNYSQHIRRDTVMAQEAAEFELPAIFKPGHHTPPEKPNLFGRLSDALKSPPSAEAERSRTVIRFEPASAGRMIEPPPSTTVALPSGRDVSSMQVEPQPHLKPDSVKREMASFFDTRLNRIGEMTRAANAPKAEPVPEPQVASAPPHYHQPPVLPEAPPPSHHNAGVEDVAAQLLRPILKQWLTDNMPKIVEKALRSEAGDDDGQAMSQNGRRKPGG